MNSYGKISDIELTDLLKSGDHAAFTEIYDRYWSVLYLHARHMLGNRDNSRDIVQEVFTTLWNKQDKLELSISLNAYLYKAVRNSVLNLIRKEKQESKYIESIGDFYEKGDFNTDETVNFNELKRIIEMEVALLPKKMREVFELSRNANLSHAEIAAQLNISDHTVKSHINKAIHILRDKLGIPITLLVLYLNNK